MNLSKPSDTPSAPQPRGRQNGDATASGFGTFGGVFTPCTLTILGVIMFLRFGYVVGNSGLFWALIILALSKLITTLTTFSLSAVATNTRVEGGGAYFLISRSLGAEFGGAIGIVFFLAQAISVAMYVIGFTEAFAQSFDVGLGFKVIATIVNIVVFACVYIGAGWTIRIQYFILGTLALSLISFFWGGLENFSTAQMQENLRPKWVEGESLFTMFALFFPAVTGIMAGANMSGDLRNPSKSIPSGTLWSILATGLVYGAMAVILAGAAARGDLSAATSETMIVRDVSKWGALVTAGVFAATLSSALGSMMGAPRILQALARDTIFPSLKMFGAGSGPNSEPRRAIIVTFIISQICIIRADLNTIAPYITMAFMITYGTINLATFYESITHNPSYRPTFRYSHWAASLAGAIGCTAVMVLIDWKSALAATLLMGMIYYYIYQKQVVSRWGDLGSGLLFERARNNLLKLERQLYHPKNWRPIILVMSGGGGNRTHLVILGHWLTSGHGILSLGQVIQGNVEDRLDRIENQESLLERYISEQELDAFPNVVAAPSLTEGIEYLIQCSGLGALRPNTLLLGWPAEESKAEPLVASLRVIKGLRRNVIIARSTELEAEPRKPPKGTIDVWWRGRQNGELMLLLAHLLKQNRDWSTRKIRLMRIVNDDSGVEEVTRHLEELATESRIEADPVVFVASNAKEVIQRESQNSAVVILGFELPDEGGEGDFFRQMESLASGIPRALFVSSIGNMKLDS
ncbi:MAG: amino acid permease [Planctomycetota bacterium]